MTSANDMTVRNEATSQKPRPWLRLMLMLLVVASLGAGLIGYQWFKAGILKQVTTGIAHAQPTVATATAVMQPWQATLVAVGSLRASNGADLALETAGVVETIQFQSGRDVEAGAVLLRLRLNDDDAKLQQMQATVELDAITYKRDLMQLKARGVAQSTVDTDAGSLKVARAQVLAQQAVINEKTMRAPFSGRLGVRQIDLGQYLAAGTTIVTLQALDPMFVDFYLPQQALAQLTVGKTIAVSIDAYPGKKFAGVVSSLNSKVDATSRMLLVRATIANVEKMLLPGMFVTATIPNGPAQSLVTVPQTAVAYNPYGSLVYVVRAGTDPKGQPQNVVQQRFVTTGATRGDQVSILAGLKAGDVVVTAGQLKLHDNAAVKINNTLNVTNDAAPVPLDH